MSNQSTQRAAASLSPPQDAFAQQDGAPASQSMHILLQKARVWIVIPCYKVKGQIDKVLDQIPSWVEGVVVIDDKCPEGSGDYAADYWKDQRLNIERHDENQGVGGAVITGYRHAAAQGAGVIVKVDGDNQMDLRLLPSLVLPIVMGLADFTKGNRFFSGAHVRGMPSLRIFGNAVLSLLSKISTGYWNIFDPTNGYTAIDGRVARELLQKDIAKRYFFESDLLYHLGTFRAVVKDVPMPARYGEEQSDLKVTRIFAPFLFYHLRNTMKRFIGQYIVRDFSAASLEFIFGVAAILFGVSVAITYNLSGAAAAEEAASAGIVMLAFAPVIIGVQLLLSGLNYDVLNVPKEPIHRALRLMDAVDGESDLTREQARLADSLR
jgi:glycosyltransferase involved in cell wall biosynthesis